MLAACVALCLFVALLDVLSPSTRGCYEVTIDSLRWIGDMRLVRTDPRMLGSTQSKVRLALLRRAFNLVWSGFLVWSACAFRVVLWADDFHVLGGGIYGGSGGH